MWLKDHPHEPPIPFALRSIIAINPSLAVWPRRQYASHPSFLDPYLQPWSPSTALLLSNNHHHKQSRCDFAAPHSLRRSEGAEMFCWSQGRRQANRTLEINSYHRRRIHNIQLYILIAPNPTVARQASAYRAPIYCQSHGIYFFPLSNRDTAQSITLY